MNPENQPSHNGDGENISLTNSKKKRTGKVIYTIAIIIFSCIMLFSLYKVVSILTQYRIGESEYEDIAEEFVEEYETYVIPEHISIIEADTSSVETDTSDDAFVSDEVYTEPDTVSDTTEEKVPEAPKESVIVVPKVDIDYLKSKNSDFAGWLYLDGTAINYPVAHGTDNEYYLTHTFYGQSNINGCIFIDYRNNSGMDNKNLLIYGHHMKSGAMFAVLRKYVWHDFYYSHKYLTYVTEDGPYLITVFSAYNVSEISDAWKTDFANEQEYAAWLSNIKHASEISTNITPTVEDKVVTLTTCSFVYDNARMVVHGIIQPLF